MSQNRNFCADIQEVKLEKNDITSQNFLAIFNCLLYECQCFIYLVDITNKESFELIKKLHEKYNYRENQYLSIILVNNKMDLESQREVSENEIKSFIDNNKEIKVVNISLKSGENLNDLLYSCLSSKNNNLGINIVSELGDINEEIGFSSIVKLILVGDSKVGKTSLLSRYLKNEFFEETLSTIGLNDGYKKVKIGNEIIKVIIWDTAGQERFRALPKNYYHKADGMLLLPYRPVICRSSC